MVPVLKWAGGKRKLLPQLIPLLPASFEHYYEPFLGGGAMFFHVASHWPRDKQSLFRWFLNDANPDLMNFYQSVTQNAGSVAAIASHYAQNHSPENYKRVRRLFNAMRVMLPELATPTLRWQHAAAFLYLNKTCFNGLYRVNQETGDYNVSGNDKATWRPDFATLNERLAAPGIALTRATLASDGFEKFFEYCIADADGSDCFFFVDPPYVDAKEKQLSFAGYQRAGWSHTDLRALALCLHRVDWHGARFMLTHLDTPLIRELFNHPDYNFTEVQAARSISCKGSTRKPVSEVVVRNYT